MNPTRPFTLPSPLMRSVRAACRVATLGLSIVSLTIAHLPSQPVASARTNSSPAHPALSSAPRVTIPSQGMLAVLAPSDDCVSITSGSVVTETISFVGDGDCFSFTAHQGDLITLYMVNETTGGQRRLSLSLRTTEGIQIASANSNSAGANVQKRLFRLPADGTYIVVTSGMNDTVGPYKLWYSNLSLNAAMISDGQSVRGEIDYPGDGELFTFNGHAGERITLFVNNLMVTGTRKLAMTVYKPTSTSPWQNPSSSLGGWDIEGRGYSLPDNGTYMVVVEGASDSIGGYQLGYSNISQDVTVVEDGQTFGQSISFAGDEDAFAFMGCSGDIVTVFGDNMTTEGDRRLTLTLSGPNGAAVSTNSSTIAGNDVQLKDVTLTSAGQYQIIANGYRDTTGPYTGTFSYLDLPPQCGSLALPDHYEANNTCLTATRLATYTLPAWTANLHNGADVDFFSLVITRPGTTILATLNQPEKDYDLSLYDACASPAPPPVQEQRTRQNGVESLVYNIGATAATTYYLKVEGFDGASAELPYDLQIDLNVDSLEPNGTCNTSTVVSSTSPASSYLSYAGDVDFFKVFLGNPYTTLRARLQHPDQDYDLTLYNGCATSADLARHIGQTRQVGDERLSYNIGADPGWYYIKVNGLDGAYSSRPYTLTVTPEPLGAQDYGALLVTHRSRLQTRYGAPAEQNLNDRLAALASQPSVAGLVVDVGVNLTVTAAYAAWDADPGDVALANATAQAVKAAILDQLNLHPNVRYVVLTGGDPVIPFYRTRVVPDPAKPSQVWLNESDYLELFDSDWNESDPTVEALEENYSLTDDYYGSDNGISARGHTVYLPSRAVGRLVETPDEMGALIDAFLATGGRKSLTAALSAGANMVSDAAQNACDAFSASGLTTVCLASNSWNADGLRAGWLNAAQAQNIAGINTSANHASFAAPAGGAVTTQDALNATASLSGSLVYGLGNHSGLNIEPGNPSELDWPQALARKGANLVGNTGWAYGLAEGTGLSEAMVKLLTDALVAGDGATLGDALLQAKRAYYLGAARFDHFDEKTLVGFTLYGLPMLAMESAAGVRAAPSGPHDSMPASPASPTIDAPRFTAGAQIEAEIDVAVEQQELSFGAPVSQTTPFGQYYALDGRSGAPDGQPIQPRHIANTYAISNPIHGAVLVNATYTDVQGIDPVIAAAINPSSTAIAEPAFQTTSWTPEVLLHIQRAPGLFDAGMAQELVIDTGQYLGNASAGTQRLYSDMMTWLYRSNSSDWAPPTIGCILANSTVTGTQMRVAASDATGIYGVLVAYTTGSDQWQSLDLSRGSGNVWAGTIPALAPALLVQVVDQAGNVAIRALSESAAPRSDCLALMPRINR